MLALQHFWWVSEFWLTEVTIANSYQRHKTVPVSIISPTPYISVRTYRHEANVKENWLTCRLGFPHLCSRGSQYLGSCPKETCSWYRNFLGKNGNLQCQSRRFCTLQRQQCLCRQERHTRACCSLVGCCGRWLLKVDDSGTTGPIYHRWLCMLPS